MLKTLLSENKTEQWKNKLSLTLLFSLCLLPSSLLQPKDFTFLLLSLHFFLNKDTEMFSAKISGCFSVFILLRLSLVFEDCFNHSLFLNSPFLCALLAVCLNLCLLCGFFTLSPSLKWQCFSGFCSQPDLFSFLIPDVLNQGHASESL